MLDSAYNTTVKLARIKMLVNISPAIVKSSGVPYPTVEMVIIVIKNDWRGSQP
jgi:hypothetical protein